MKMQVRVKAKSSPVSQGKPPIRQRRDAWTQWLETLAAEEREGAIALKSAPAGLDGLEFDEAAAVEQPVAVEPWFLSPAPKQPDREQRKAALETSLLEGEDFAEETLPVPPVEAQPVTDLPNLGSEEPLFAPPQNQDDAAPTLEESEQFLDTSGEQETEPASVAAAWFHSKAQSTDSPPEAPPTDDPSIEAEPSQLNQILAQEQPTQLPYKPLLESRLGQSLNEVEVYAGTPAVRAVLTNLGAKAAHYDRKILLSESQPPLEIVTHEVVHALQSAPGLQPTVPSPLPASDSAEREAEQLTREIVHSLDADTSAAPWAPVVVNAALQRSQIACLRDAPPATLSESPTPQAAFTTRTEPDQPILSAPEPAQTVETEPSEAQTDTEAALSDRDPAPISDDLEAVPALAVPPPPESGVTAADVAARDAELAAAEAALANAADVDEKVDAYAAAPPTLKARSYGALGADMDALSKAENETFQEEMPDFQAKLSGETEEPPAVAVASPAAEPVSLEDGTPEPAPEPEVSPTADPGTYTGNDALQRTIARFTEGNSPQDRASEIGDTLSDVQTTDPAVDTSPGPAPAVPLAGETDPQRIENQVLTGRDRATQASDEAQQAVLTGPGPEQVQPVIIEEAIPLEPLVPPEVTQPEVVTGIDEFSAREMPPEVNTAFDLTNQEPMQASMTEAQTKVQEATDQRDRDRQEQVDTAQTEANQQTLEADTAQRTEVQTQRESIQTERQQTLNDQQAAVQSVEADAETRRRDDQANIDDRVRTDQATIRTDYAQAERDSEAEVQGGERKAADKKKAAEREAENESWWDRAVNFVQRAFAALTSAIGAIFDAVRSAINRILDAVKAAAEALIALAANFIKAAIEAFGELLKGLINDLLGSIFPGLAAALTEFVNRAVHLAQSAVDAVAETLRNGINALVEGLRAGLNAVLDVLQAGLEFATALIQAALAGDWGAVIRLLLEAVLKVVGIEPETFYGFIGRAEETFQKILDNPGAIVGYLLDAVKLGIQKFADNFLPNLQTGIIGWLTGSLGSDLEIPNEFSVIGVLDLARQIIGLTLQFIRRIAVRLIGEENVARIESIIGHIQTLISGGWAALFEQIAASLANVRDMVLTQIKDFLVTRLVLAAITKLATLFNPVGAIVQLVLTAWNFYTFLRENLQRLVQIVQSIVEGISSIVNGNINPAADRIEGTLANLLPVAISFLANLLGIGGIANRVRQIIDRLRDRIENAIVSFIRRIAARFTGRGRPGSAESTPAEAETDSIENIHIDLTIGAEDHDLDSRASSYELILSSNNPTLLSAHPSQTVRNAYATYLSEIAAATSATAKRRAANRNIRIIVARITAASSPDSPGASAPGIGTIAPHRNQQSRLSRSNIPVWILESEHVIPRAIVNAAFEALAQAGVPAGRADYNNMHTILIYKGAADLKTEGASGDFSRINIFKAAVREILIEVFETHQSDPASARTEMARAVLNLLNGFAADATQRTNEAINAENRQNKQARGPQGSPESPTPNASAVNSAYGEQRSDINRQLQERIDAFIARR